MGVKLCLGDLNPVLYPLHSINTYICRVITTPRMCGGFFFTFYLWKKEKEKNQ